MRMRMRKNSDGNGGDDDNDEMIEKRCVRMGEHTSIGPTRGATTVKAYKGLKKCTRRGGKDTRVRSPTGQLSLFTKERRVGKESVCV